MLLSFLLLAFGQLVCCFTQDELKFQFESWKLEHNKSYENELEEATRFTNFIATVVEITMQNEQQKINGGGAVFGLNHFSDMTNEEWRGTYLIKEKNFRAMRASHRHQDTYNDMLNTYERVHALPSQDWRKSGFVTPVKNQGRCASCWAFAATEAVESAYLVAKKPVVPLSAQQLVDCVRNLGCGADGGGVAIWALDYAKASGITSEKVYPYRDSKNAQCQLKPGSPNYKLSYAAEIYGPPRGNLTEARLLDFASSGPVVVGIDVGSWRNYRGGVMMANQCAKTGNWHYAQVVGWDMKSNYWLMRNSWGPSWGEQGYIRLQYGQDICRMITGGGAYPARA